MGEGPEVMEGRAHVGCTLPAEWPFKRQSGDTFRKHDGTRPRKNMRKFCFYSGGLLRVF